MLAQLETVPSETLKNFVLIVAGFLAMAYFVKEIFFKRESPPQPFEVREAKDFVHKQTFDDFATKNEREHENLFSKIGGVERGARIHLDGKLDAMQKSANDGQEKLHDRINDVLAAVSELRGTVNELKR